MPNRVFRFASAFKIMTFYLFQELGMNNGGGNNETFLSRPRFCPSLNLFSSLCVNEQINLKSSSNVNSLELDSRIKILRTLGFSNSSLLIRNIHQEIRLIDYLYNLRKIFTESSFKRKTHIFSAQFTSRQVRQKFNAAKYTINN